MVVPGERNLNDRKKGTVPDLQSACEELASKLDSHQIRLPELHFHSITWVSPGTQHSPAIFLNIILCILLTLGYITHTKNKIKFT